MPKSGTLAAFALALAAWAAPSHAAEPKLLVVISVDQYSADLFAEYRSRYETGLRRLSDGIVFPSGFQSHGATETCPGHSTILTGSRPSRTGITGNHWIDPAVRRGPNGSGIVYCSEDEEAAGSSPENYVVSPRHLRVQTLGDRMKKADPRSRVVAVAGKDRAAVMMGGHSTDEMWFLDPRTTRSFVTLADRGGAEPGAVARANAELANRRSAPREAELPSLCRTMVAPVQTQPSGPVVGVDGGWDEIVQLTPDHDQLTADIAIGFIRDMRLGKGSAPDLLAIGLSANDYVGHAFGTGGPEMCRQQFALDATIGRILAALDANRAPYVVVLTADHGGIDIPERSQLRGLTDATRLDRSVSLEAISREIVKELDLEIDPKRLWQGYLGSSIYLSPEVPEMKRTAILKSTREKLLASPQMEAVFTSDELAAAPEPKPPVDDWSLIEKARASFDRSRSGDLVTVLKPRVMGISQPMAGFTATHGSPWNYDRRVPILFYSPDIVGYEMPLSIETVDILPTLAALIGLPVAGAEIDGRCIDLDRSSVNTCPVPQQAIRR